MPIDKLPAPCRECPFLRDSNPGWLGASTAEEFVYGATHDAQMPCHMTINYEDPNWKESQYPESAYCAGHLRFMVNWLKRPRDPQHSAAVSRQALIARNEGGEPNDFGAFPNVFTQPEEFLAHHDNEDNRRYVQAHQDLDKPYPISQDGE